MLSQHVEPHVLGCLDIKYHSGIRRRCVQSVRPVALIQKTVVEIRCSVQEKTRNAVLIFLHGEGTVSKVTEDRILLTGHGEGIQFRVFRCPECKIFRRDTRGKRIVCPVKMSHRTCFSHDLGTDLHALFVNFRRDDETFDICLRDAFHPYGLPDAALRSVPHAAAFVPLFAVSMVSFIGVVLNADLQKIAFGQIFRDVNAEGKIASGMTADLLMVQIDDGLLIHCAEVKKDPAFVESRRKKEHPLIPEILGGEECFLHTGKRTFR